MTGTIGTTSYLPSSCPSANTVANTYCIVPQATAHTLCDTDPNCGGYGTTSAAGWSGTALGGYQLMAAGTTTSSNPGWTTYLKN
jgi:hypothetical protein